MAKKFTLDYDPKYLDKFRKENYTRISTFEDLVDAYVKDTLDAQHHRVRVGAPSADNYLRLSKSDVITIISHTGGRKTQYARNVILDNAKVLDNKLMIVFSLELLQGDEGERYLTMLMDKSGEDLEADVIHNHKDFTKRGYQAGQTGKLNNLITITETIDIADMIPFVRWVQEMRGGMEVGLIVLDYIQLVENDEKRGAYDQLGDIAKKLKKVNLALGVPIINISQVNRDAARNKMDLFSGKGSGEIENSSQVLLKLERPDPNEEYPIKKGEHDLKKFPFGKDQEAVIKYLEANENIEMHKLTILKQKKIRSKVKKPTCYIAFDRLNLTMKEWYVPEKPGREPIIDVPKKQDEDEDEENLF